MAEQASTTEGDVLSLVAFLRARQDDILAAWAAETGRVLPPRGSDLLARIADAVEQGLSPDLDIGPDDAALLRRCVLERWAAEVGPRLEAAEVLRFDRALDSAAREEQRHRETLIGVIGHDLRNPLHAISVTSEGLLRLPDLHERQRRAVARIFGCTQRIERMVEALVDFTRARLAGGIPVHPRETDLREIARMAVDEHALAHPTRLVQLETRGDCIGRWDPDRLEQVISNLVGNALQHGAAATPVSIRIDGFPEEIVLEVHNEGRPIPIDVLPRMFEPFQRLHPSTRSLGLGLYIVREIVAAHGGRVECVSNETGGTTFRVVLPRA